MLMLLTQRELKAHKKSQLFRGGNVFVVEYCVALYYATTFA